MNSLILKRGYTPLGTFGEMTMPNGIKLYTVERPWLNNQASISCIPPATYACEPRFFFRGSYDAVEVLNVPGREHILFHVANLPTELEGCIAPVSRLGVVNNAWGGLASKNAFDLFMSFYGKERFELKILGLGPA